MPASALKQSSVTHADNVLAVIGKGLPGVLPYQLDIGVFAVLSAIHAAIDRDAEDVVGDCLPADLQPVWRRMAATSAVWQRSRPESLVMAVAKDLPPDFPHHACLLVRVMLAAIASSVSPDSVRTIMAALPAHFRKLWPHALWRGEGSHLHDLRLTAGLSASPADQPA